MTKNKTVKLTLTAEDQRRIKAVEQEGHVVFDLEHSVYVIYLAGEEWATAQSLRELWRVAFYCETCKTTKEVLNNAFGLCDECFHETVNRMMEQRRSTPSTPQPISVPGDEPGTTRYPVRTPPKGFA